MIAPASPPIADSTAYERTESALFAPGARFTHFGPYRSKVRADAKFAEVPKPSLLARHDDGTFSVYVLHGSQLGDAA